MSLPPPKLRDLKLMNQAENSCENEKDEVWEIGVPAKRSLYWSVILSYLLFCSDDRFSALLNTLNCRQTAEQTNRRSRSCSSNCKVIKQYLKAFNPFKNRHAFFHVKGIADVMSAFKLKLNQFANKRKMETGKWGDTIKLQAASELLKCKIKIYFPDNIQKRPLCFPKKEVPEVPEGEVPEEKLPLIILFQYEDQTYGARTEDINIFRFAMTIEYAHHLKLDALVHILETAKLSTSDIGNIQQIMSSVQAHGKCFLPILLKSPFFNILPNLYKSPYIALKLSEAGFETNPADVNPCEPSPFLYAMIKPETKYIRILYDYAVNCRYLFDKTVRDADETILESIQNVRVILEKDKSYMQNTKTMEKVWTLNNVFSTFNAFQQEMATSVSENKRRKVDQMNQSHSLKANKAKANKEILNIQKQVIHSILENYSKFFYYNSDGRNTILDKYKNYLNFTEYYENIDYFSCLCFFDNIHLLKEIFQIENEDIYASIESTFFLLIVSSKYFPKFDHDIHCKFDHDRKECEYSPNALRIIPLLYRENLNTEMQNFKKKLESEKLKLVSKQKIKGDYFRSSLSSFPVIRDELLTARIKKYLKASSQVLLERDGIKGVLVIERTFQIIGESIKPQSTKDCVVSCLLRSRIPQNIREDLKNIRNLLSHYGNVLAGRRLEIEQNINFYKKLQYELGKIGKAFEIVAFTQYLRLKEYLIEKGQKELTNYKLDKTFIDNFLEDNKKIIIKQRNDYIRYENECIKLSLDIINDLIMYISEDKEVKTKDKGRCNSDLDKFVTSIEYVFLFMSKLRDEGFFQPYLQKIQKYYQEYKSKKELPNFAKSIECLFIEYTESVKEKFTLRDFSDSRTIFPATESFLKQIILRYVDESDMDLILQAVKNSYDEAVKAKNDLKEYIKLESFGLTFKEESLLKKLVISPASFKKLKEYFKNKKVKHALKELNKSWTDKDNLLNITKKMLESNSVDDCKAKTLMIKLTYQRHLRKKIYTSVNLNESLCNKLENIMLKKTQFLLSRINDMKSILIDEDEEIKKAWDWGRSKEMKSHMKSLMRQRFLREMPVRAALEMALFDCLNILLREDFRELYEKLNNLFTSINLRNVLSHGHCLLETTCSLIDEDDLPEELINKVLDLIKDSEAIRSMLKLIPYSETLEKESFEAWINKIENDQGLEKTDERVKKKIKDLVKKVTGCQKWRSYMFLLPLIETSQF